MSSLIYTCCYGREFARLLPPWLDSLRGEGGFDGEVWVLTDQEPSSFGDGMGGRARFIRCRQWPERTGHYEKTSILDVGDLGDYDAILYVDCDIVTVNPVEPLLSLSAENRPPLLPATPKDMGWDYTSDLLTEDEVRRVRDDRVPGINTGVIGLNGTNAAPFLDAWRSAMREHLRPGVPDPVAWDQAFVNRMVVRGEIPPIRYFPGESVREWVYNLGWRDTRAVRSGALVLIHFTGTSVDTKLRSMRRMRRKARRAKRWYGSVRFDYRFDPIPRR